MLPDSAYLSSPGLAAARFLQRAGQWDLALVGIQSLHSPAAAALRAEILVDRHAWQLDPPAEALAAVAALEESDRPLAVLLTGELAYWQRVFGQSGPTIGPEPGSAFAEAESDSRLQGWAVFFGAVVQQYLRTDLARAAKGFAAALAAAADRGDLLLESYALRHQGELALDDDRDLAARLLRRSLNLRAALGARPHCAAGQAVLADALGDVPEAAELRSMVSRAAEELGLAWLR